MMKKQQADSPKMNFSPKFVGRNGPSVQNNGKKQTNEYQKIIEIPGPINGNQSLTDKRLQDPIFPILNEKQRKVVELKQRLKNLHHFYRIRIEEERQNNLKKNEIFIQMIEELQRSHNKKIIMLHQNLEEVGQGKQQMNLLDDRMGSIKSTIQQILSQSKEIKFSNEDLQHEIMRKQLIIKQKQSYLLIVQTEIEEFRQKLQQYERTKLKQHRQNRELIEIIQSSF